MGLFTRHKDTPGDQPAPHQTQKESAIAPPAAAPAPPPKNKARARDRELYKQLLDGLYDGVLICDPTGHIVTANRRAVQYFGHERDDLWNMPIRDLIGGINNTVLAKIRSHLDTGRFTVVNATCKRSDGTTFPAEIAIACINLLHEADLVFSVRNIERRQKAQTQRSDASDAVQQAATGIVMVDGWGRVIFVNPAFLRMWKLAKEDDALQRHIAEFWQDKDQADPLMKQPRQSASWSGQLTALTSDGRAFDVLATASPFRNSSGETTKIVMTFSRM